jgi:hypothetical protein
MREINRVSSKHLEKKKLKMKRLFGERCARSGLWWPKSSNIDAEGGQGNVLPTLTNSNRAQDGDQ